METPVKCVEAGWGQRCCYEHGSRQLERAAQPRGERCAGNNSGKLAFLKIDLNIMQALALHLVKLH